MDVLPPLRLINLDRSADRLRTFGVWNAHLGPVERVSATDGATLSRTELVRAGYLTESFRGGPGSLGCAMSHIRLWEAAARENRAITILEDDVVASRHFTQAAARVMSDLPVEWELVKWGWTPNLGGCVDAGGAQVRMQGDGEPPRSDDAALRTFQDGGPAAAAPMRMLWSLGLFAYSISPAGARTALRHCLPLGPRTVETPMGGRAEAAGFDEILAAAYPRMQAFLCMPSLVIHSYGDESVRMQLDRTGG